MKNKILSRNEEYLLGLQFTDGSILKKPTQYSVYTILFIKEGNGAFKADFGTFQFKAPAILFSTPLQILQLQGNFQKITMLQFHGDFYCIEYHKKEVACNGLIFNNIYIEPYISLAPAEASLFDQIINNLHAELSDQHPADSVITAYLQLFLAKATSIKMKSMDSKKEHVAKDEKMEQFKQSIDEHFLTLRSPSEYARLLYMAPGTLTKRCNRYFGKSPSHLIQERIILEAKKALHLTRKSIKEIAHSLNFEDEHYFSRFFKKITKVSPQEFRTRTGISMVADLSS